MQNGFEELNERVDMRVRDNGFTCIAIGRPPDLERVIKPIYTAIVQAYNTATHCSLD
jgi:hypothetical protein